MHALIAVATFPAKHVRFNDEEMLFTSTIQYLRASELTEEKKEGGGWNLLRLRRRSPDLMRNECRDSWENSDVRQGWAPCWRCESQSWASSGPRGGSARKKQEERERESCSNAACKMPSDCSESASRSEAEGIRWPPLFLLSSPFPSLRGRPMCLGASARPARIHSPSEVSGPAQAEQSFQQSRSRCCRFPSPPPLLPANLFIRHSQGEADNEADGLSVLNPPAIESAPRACPLLLGLSNVNQQCKQQSLHATVLHRYKRAPQHN